MTSILKLEDISYKYDSNFQLSNIKFELPDKEITCLIGESGSGKSTLLKIISGLETPNSGEIALFDNYFFSKKNKINLPPEKRNIALIFQHPSLFPNKSILENVKFAVRNSQSAESFATEMLKMVDMEKYADKAPHQLSGGQQQLVTLARAFAQEPRLLLLDEPFSSLDAILRPIIREKVINLIKQQNLTSIIVTHDPQEALEIADKIIVIRDGKIVTHNTPKNVYYHPPDIRTAKLFGKINNIPIKIEENCINSTLGKINKPENIKFNSVYIRPEGIRLANQNESEFVIGIVKKIHQFSKMVSFSVNNCDYWMKFPIDTLPKKNDIINLKLDSSYLLFF